MQGREGQGLVGRETTNLFTGPRRRTGRDRCLLMGALFFRAGQKGREEPCQRGTLGTLWLLVLLHCIHIAWGVSHSMQDPRTVPHIGMVQARELFMSASPIQVSITSGSSCAPTELRRSQALTVPEDPHAPTPAPLPRHRNRPQQCVRESRCEL